MADEEPEKEEVAAEEGAEETTEAAAPEPPMDAEAALKAVLKNALCADGLRRGRAGRTSHPSFQVPSTLLNDLGRAAAKPLLLREGGKLHRLHHLALQLCAPPQAHTRTPRSEERRPAAAVVSLREASCCQRRSAPSNSRYRLWTVHSLPSSMTVTMYSA